MDWKQFISNLVSSLAWPIVGAMFLFTFRSELGKIIRRLAHLKYRDLELDFDTIRQQAEELHEEIERPEIAVKNPVFVSLEDQILDAVERAPSAAILLAWSALETAIASAVARMAISPESPSYRSPMHNVEMLIKYAGLSKKREHLLQEMRTLRNKVAHERDSLLSITQEQALNYANAAIDMIQHLEHLQRDD
jgi:uncharacterized protein YutE (UPF0331/DUF86 family)